MFWLGLLLGFHHALDADHVVAVTTIVSRERSLGRAARIGVWWGIGHSTTIMLVGGAIVVFRIVVPPRVGLAFEFVVALMLIALGALNLWRVRSDTPARTISPVAVGFVHGLAGSAAIALLVVATIPDPWHGVLYLAVFGLGTIAGMSSITFAIATPALFAARRGAAIQRYVRAGAGALALALGLLLVHDIGYRQQLFAAAPAGSGK